MTTTTEIPAIPPTDATEYTQDVPWPEWKNTLQFSKETQKPFGSVKDALEYAAKIGYTFVAWNDYIWYTNKDGSISFVVVVKKMSPHDLDWVHIEDIDWQLPSRWDVQ